MMCWHVDRDHGLHAAIGVHDFAPAPVPTKVRV
jgi:hypothetical protein